MGTLDPSTLIVGPEDIPDDGVVSPTRILFPVFFPTIICQESKFPEKILM